MGYSANWNATDQIPLRAVQNGSIDRFGAIDPSDGGHTSRYSLSGEWRQTDGNVSRNANVYAIRSKLTLSKPASRSMRNVLRASFASCPRVRPP